VPDTAATLTFIDSNKSDLEARAAGLPFWDGDGDDIPASPS
jgi:hypothetical protein